MNSTRHYFPGFVSFLLTALAVLQTAEAQLMRQNIVYIIDVQLGYYEPGFMDGRNIQTPNLDRMAAEGVRFNNLFAGSSVCAPTRCCLMTGRHSGPLPCA